MMDEITAYANALKSGGTPQEGGYYWPQQDDLALSKKVDSFYGSPHAPYLQPNSAYVKTTDRPSVIKWYDQASAGNDQGPTSVRALSTQADADRNRALAIAAERSAMAKLGWDPGREVSSPRDGNKALTINGVFSGPSNASWYDQNVPNAALHEAMHRSMRMLRNTGKLPLKVSPGKAEEYYVRALMQRGYGNIEAAKDIERWGKIPEGSDAHDQLVKGMQLKNDPIVDQLEKLAAEEIARKRPRGPR